MLIIKESDLHALSCLFRIFPKFYKDFPNIIAKQNHQSILCNSSMLLNILNQVSLLNFKAQKYAECKIEFIETRI